MHNLKTNYDKFFDLIIKQFSTQLNAQHCFRTYRHQPKLSDAAVIALAVSAEAIGIDSENYFWNKLKSEHRLDFPGLIDRSNFNRRKKSLASYLEKINSHIATLMSRSEDVFIVDSIPVPVCHLTREKRSRICKQFFETAPDKGYSAVTKSYYFGYKLHLLTTINGVFSSMDLSKASVHDVHYLNQVKGSGLANCTLIADKGYLSSAYQIDLFEHAQINLQTPMRSNQKNHEPFAPVYRRCRKRIETLFSQLCDQFMLKRNYAKTLAGLSVRIVSKITAVTFLQFINFLNHKPLNHLKYALCSFN